MKIILVLTLLLITFSGSKAQFGGGPLNEPTDFTPCAIPEGGCNEPWGPLEWKDVPVTCGTMQCTVRVYFKKRIACPGSQNFYDLSIGWIYGGPSGWQCGSCLSAMDILDQVTQALLNGANPTLWGEFIPPDVCIVNFRVSAASCWKQGIWPFKPVDIIPEQYWWVGCTTFSCCVRPWQVCNRFGALIAAPLGPSVANGPVECYTWTSERQQSGQCYGICGQ